MAKRQQPQDDLRAKSMPTPAEIRQQCEAIQQTWSQAEAAKRAAWSSEQEAVRFPEAIDHGNVLLFEGE